MAPPRRETCIHGHNDWRYNKRGNRDCRTCHNARKRLNRSQVNPVSYGTLWDTMTHSEIMKARGYV